MYFVDSDRYFSSQTTIAHSAPLYSTSPASLTTSYSTAPSVVRSRAYRPGSSQIVHEHYCPQPCLQPQQRRCRWSADKSQWRLWYCFLQRITMVDQPKAQGREWSVCCWVRTMAIVSECPTVSQVSSTVFSYKSCPLIPHSTIRGRREGPVRLVSGSQLC